MLSRMDLSAQAVDQARLLDQEVDGGEGALLGFERDAGKPRKPCGDLIVFVGALESAIVVAAMRKDGGGQSESSTGSSDISWAAWASAFSAIARPIRPLPSSKGWIDSK